jgi:hypothetical protein
MGMFHDAGEAIKDLFRNERITIIDETGKEVTKTLKPEPLQNPIKLLRMLTWKACKCAKPHPSQFPPRFVVLTALFLDPHRALLRRRLGLMDRRWL